MIRRKPLFQKGNSGGSFARFGRFGGGQVVDAAPRMGFDIGQRLVLAGHVIQRIGQKCVLLDIGKVPGMEEVLVGQHGVL